MVRRFGALFFVAIFVLGTATTAFVFTQTAQTTGNAVPTAAPGVPTAAINQAAQSTAAPGQTPQATDKLVQTGDDSALAGNYKDAISYYRSALALNPGNAPDIQFKLGKALLKNQQVQDGVTTLQAAVAASPNASWVGDANALITQYKNTTPASTAGSANTPPGAATAAPAATP